MASYLLVLKEKFVNSVSFNRPTNRPTLFHQFLPSSLPVIPRVDVPGRHLDRTFEETPTAEWATTRNGVNELRSAGRHCWSRRARTSTSSRPSGTCASRTRWPTRAIVLFEVVRVRRIIASYSSEQQHNLRLCKPTWRKTDEHGILVLVVWFTVVCLAMVTWTTHTWDGYAVDLCWRWRSEKRVSRVTSDVTIVSGRIVKRSNLEFTCILLAFYCLTRCTHDELSLYGGRGRGILNRRFYRLYNNLTFDRCRQLLEIKKFETILFKCLFARFKPIIAPTILSLYLCLVHCRTTTTQSKIVRVYVKKNDMHGITTPAYHNFVNLFTCRSTFRSRPVRVVQKVKARNKHYNNKTTRPNARVIFWRNKTRCILTYCCRRCVYSCVRMHRWWTRRKRFEINLSFSTILSGLKRHPSTYSTTLSLMTLTYFLKVKDANRYHFGRVNVVISQMVTERVNIIIANI